MLYVSSQICHGRLIIFQPGADTDVWHDVFFVFVWACWRLVPHRSKLKNGNSCSWQQIAFGTECWIFLWQDVGKESSLLTGLCIFFVRLTVTVGFGPVDGWFLTGPNSKLERVSASWQQITFGTECWIFFRGKRLGKSPVFWLGYAFFLWAWRWDPTDNLHVFFGFLWACWRWVPHRSQNQNWEETIFFKDRAQYCTMNIILHAHLHRTRTTHIIFKLVLQSR